MTGLRERLGDWYGQVGEDNVWKKSEGELTRTKSFKRGVRRLERRKDSKGREGTVLERKTSLG